MTPTLDSVETVHAVVNPESGDGDGEALYGELVHRFTDADVRKRVTTGPDDVPVAVRDGAESDLLVCVGGDGTLGEVASALLDLPDPPPVFVVPAGRGNSAHRHLYGDVDWRAAASAVADGGECVPFDVGVATVDPLGERRFVLGFTAGLFRSAVVHAESFDLLPGPLAYVLGTARAAFTDDPVPATLAVDGEPVFDGAARLLAVAGGRYRGSDFELFPDSRPGDGHVHAMAVEPTGVREMVDIARCARARTLSDHPAVHHATGETAVLESGDGLPVEVDGTPVETPVTRARIEMTTQLQYARPSVDGLVDGRTQSTDGPTVTGGGSTQSPEGSQ